MSVILEAIYEYLVPLMPVVQYSGESLRRGGCALGSGYDPGAKPDFQVHENRIKDAGPVVEVGWDDGEYVNVGATIMMELGADIPTIWVERNTNSGKPHGNLYVEVADPKSFDKIVEFLT